MPIYENKQEEARAMILKDRRRRTGDTASTLAITKGSAHSIT
jgi:hypothetical protein